MAFIVIECFPDLEHACIVVDPDSGENIVFSTKEEAEEEADNCQDGLIIKI